MSWLIVLLLSFTAVATPTETEQQIESWIDDEVVRSACVEISHVHEPPCTDMYEFQCPGGCPGQPGVCAQFMSVCVGELFPGSETVCWQFECFTTVPICVQCFPL